jgi:hypothetical protein
MVQCELLLCEENIDLFKIVASESAHFEILSEIERNGNFKQRIIGTMSQSITVLADFIQYGIGKGMIKKVNPKDAASALLAMVREFAFRWIMESEEGRLRDKADIIITIFLDGLRQKDHIVDQH